jgi:hypothetical protein
LVRVEAYQGRPPKRCGELHDGRSTGARVNWQCGPVRIVTVSTPTSCKTARLQDCTTSQVDCTVASLRDQGIRLYDLLLRFITQAWFPHISIAAISECIAPFITMMTCTGDFPLPVAVMHASRVCHLHIKNSRDSIGHSWRGYSPSDFSTPSSPASPTWRDIVLV